MIRNIAQVAVAAVVSLLTALPAHAANGAAVPEADTFSLISLAIAGVLIGRRLSMRNRKD